MSIINSISSATSATYATDTASQSLGQEEFLKLLVTQLRYQDPLSPLESHEYASQLAEYSSLEQLVSINEGIGQGTQADLILTTAINNTLAATLIGQEVKAFGNTIEFNSGESTEVNFQLGSFADEVKVEIYDTAGNLVKTIDANALSSGDHSVTWDGTNEHGEEMPEGDYTFSVSAKDASGGEITATELVVGLISAVRFESGSAMLVVGGREISFSNVLEIGLNNEG